MGAPAVHAATLAEFTERFITKRQVDGASPKTIIVYRQWLTHARTDRHFGGLAAHVADVESLDSRAMAAYFTMLRDRGLKPSSRHQALRTIKTFVRWLEKRSVHGPLPSGDPLEDVDVSVPKTLPAIPSVEDLSKILAACMRYDPARGDGRLVALRNLAAVLTMCDSGLRRQEVVNLNVADFRRGDQNTPPSFYIRQGKGSKDRIASCGAKTAEAIRVYLREREDFTPADPLFATAAGGRMDGDNFGKVLQRICERAGLKRFSPHDLRHFCATAWIRAGVGLEQVRAQLGHTDIATTQRYLHLCPEDVQREHLRASPLERLGVDVRIPQR